jgi:hypothetical protein
MVLLLLCPVILAFGLLLALGSGFDLFKLGERPLALALSAPTVLVLLRYISALRAAAPPAPPPASEIATGPVHIPELP